MNSRGFILVICLASFWSCKKDEVEAPEISSLLITPDGFTDVVFPEDNQFSEARWLLGKELFYDPIMSIDHSVSCASCHDQALAFADNVAFSPGADAAPGVRNAPSLANVAYHPYFTREGGVPTLEMQVLVPIQEHNEFNTNILDITERLNNDQDYIDMSIKAYDRIPDPFVITRSIATFERTLISGDSRFDQYQQGKIQFSVDESDGMRLFFSEKTQCSDCHSGFNFTNYEFINNGLYDVYDDVGRYRLTRDSADLSKFKVPSLRNVGLTAPYMHDGSMSNLKDVIEHYSSGGHYHLNKDERIKPLNLTDEEQANLISFLYTLTDKTFITNELLQN